MLVIIFMYDVRSIAKVVLVAFGLSKSGSRKKTKILFEYLVVIDEPAN